jgi:aspartyl aminopeptidase
LQDPCFTVLDLLPHLAAKAQAEKKMADAIPGEKLNVVIGGWPIGAKDDGKDRIKLNVLRLLNEKYGLVEDDFVSAELEVVPAGPARNVGIDGAFVGGYGQDDRVCAYTGLRALLDLGKQPKRPAVCFFMDKEEIGSAGNTGAEGRFLLDFLGELLAREGKTSERAIRRALARTKVLSADVNAAVDPDWQDVHDKKNAAFVGRGICLTKFTGSRGKYGASDANAEFVGEIRNLLTANKAPWQTGELGKVDEGGGGTVAYLFARHGADVLDAGTALLSMHSPFELAHKDDIYSTYLAYLVFFAKA